MKKIELEELRNKMQKNEITLVDVRGEESYERAHIKRAVNIPVDTIGQDTIEKFLRDEPIVVYCTDPECMASPQAAEKLEALGFRNVYHYPGGVREWKEAGLPMEGKEVSEGSEKRGL